MSDWPAQFRRHGDVVFRRHGSARRRDREAVLALVPERGLLGKPCHRTSVRIEPLFLPVDAAGHVLIVDRTVVDVDEGVDGTGSIPQVRRVAAARVADLVDRTERDVGRLVEAQSEVDAEPCGEGIGTLSPGSRRIAVLATEFAPQTAKLPGGAIVRGAVDPGLARGDE